MGRPGWWVLAWVGIATSGCVEAPRRHPDYCELRAYQLGVDEPYLEVRQTFAGHGGLETRMVVDGWGRRTGVTRCLYDGEERLAREAFDEDDDGFVDRTLVYHYDEAGRVSTIDHYMGTRRPDYHWVYAYEHDTTIRIESLDARTLERLATRVHALNDDGNVVQKERFDADGALTRLETRRWDAHGNQLEHEVDLDADGRWDHRETHEYDPYGRPVASRRMSQGGGVVYQWDDEHFTDEAGNILETRSTPMARRPGGRDHRFAPDTLVYDYACWHDR